MSRNQSVNVAIIDTVMVFLRKKFSDILDKQSHDIKRIINNISFLFIVQLTNYVLPLIAIPYLVRVLGPEKFGLIAFAQAFIQYFMIITEYGFNFSATSSIARSHESNEKVSQIYNAVMGAKFLLCAACFVSMSTIVAIVPIFREYQQLYHVIFIGLIGNILLPIWLFQGIQQMKYITIVTLISKSCVVIMLLLLVKNPSDYLFAALIQSIGALLAGIVSLYFVIKKLNIRLLIPSIYGVIEVLKDGWYVFISGVAVSLFNNTNTLVLGLFSDNVTVGAYSAADKLVKAANNLISPISQAIYPHINMLVSKSSGQAVSFISKLIKIVGIGGLIISLMLFIFAEPIVHMLFGHDYQNSVLLVKIMAAIPFFAIMGNVSGIQTMLPFGMNKLFSTIMFNRCGNKHNTYISASDFI